jgi:peptidoglycan lytic transglycosylase G
MNLWLKGFLSCLILLGLFTFVVWYSYHLLEPVDRSGPPRRVDIPPGATVSVIANRLKQARLIRSELAFIVTARVMGDSENMKAGEYLISPALGVLQIIDRLVAGDAEAQWVTIPEGKTVGQVASLLAERRLAKVPEFVRGTQRKPKMYGLLLPVSRRSVEGYLMPDTYKFPRQVHERAIIKNMLKNWHAKVYRPNRRLFEQSDLPADKIVIAASLIEREARVPQDRKLISSVIRNRLARKMPLQIDATVLYALGRHKQALSFKDLKVDHPYNTYKHVGLPPGPICSPGLESVVAALQPSDTDYLYYVAQPDGSHIFTSTYEEHKAAIARVKAMKGTPLRKGGGK